MARFSQLAAACLLAFAGFSAHAGYAQLAPPPGFAPMPAAAPIARYGYAAANEAAWVNQTVRTTASLNVGGQAVKIPVAMRLAANAPRFASAALFAHPGLRAAIGIASLLAAAKVMWDESKQQWVKVTEGQEEFPTDTVYWTTAHSLTGNPSRFFPTRDAACQSGGPLNWPSASLTYFGSSTGRCEFLLKVTKSDGTFSQAVSYIDIRSKQMSCPIGSIPTPAGCIVKTANTRPLQNPEEFEPEVMKPKPWPNVPADWPMPSTIPQELPPGTPLPVEQPIINPTPGDNPKPQPYFVPTGNPVPNPNYDPNAAPSPENQPYFQPGVRIVPSPTLDEPWRVDVQPVNRPTTSPTPKSTDELNPQPDPATNPDPATDSGKDDKAKPEEQQSLCEKHPDILACQKLGTIEPEAIKNTDKSLIINKDEGWGPSDGSCPAPRTISLVTTAKTLEFSFQPLCDFANGVRPIIIALAWLSATLSFMGIGRKS